jgi:hypothetical protein
MTKRSLLWAPWVALRWLFFGHLSLWPFAALLGVAGLASFPFGRPAPLSLAVVGSVGIAVFGPILFAYALFPFTLALAAWFTFGAKVVARWGVGRGCLLVVAGVGVLGLLLDRREVYEVYFSPLEMGTYARGLVPFHLATMTLGPMMFGQGRALAAEASATNRGSGESGDSAL